MPNYKRKLLNPLTDEAFLRGMSNGKFVEVPKHVGFVAFIHYTALRCSEALGQVKENFSKTRSRLYVDVGKRLKHSKSTPPLRMRLNAPYVDTILESVDLTEDGMRVWPYCRKTAYNIVSRVFFYPHYHRLSRITYFLQRGYTIPEVRSWTGLSLQSLNYYVGVVSVDRMGDSMGKSLRVTKGKKKVKPDKRENYKS